jgi:hypothetical protein
MSYTDIPMGYPPYILNSKSCVQNINIGRIRLFVQDMCMKQYNIEPVSTKCSICGQILSSSNYIHYSKDFTRYVIPESYIHYIMNHNIIIDSQLIELVENVRGEESKFSLNKLTH